MSQSEVLRREREGGTLEVPPFLGSGVGCLGFHNLKPNSKNESTGRKMQGHSSGRFCRLPRPLFKRGISWEGWLGSLTSCLASDHVKTDNRFI